MEIVAGLIGIIIGNIIGIIIGLFLNKFLPSYFSKKGENLATKEDIAEITKQMEQVKQTLFKKRETYEKIVSGMRVFIQGHSATEDEKNLCLEAYSIAWLWAADDVIRKINNQLKLQIKKNKNSTSVTQEDLKQSYAECIMEMRKDSGYSDTLLNWEDFEFVRF